MLKSNNQIITFRFFSTILISEIVIFLSNPEGFLQKMSHLIIKIVIPNRKLINWSFLNKYVLVCFLSLTCIFSSVAQIHINWNTLADVKFEQQFSEEMGITYDEATFGNIIKIFEGKEVMLAGYVIPLDAMGLSFVLSRNPNASCFFCGGGGPETIVDIQVKPSALRRYSMDERKTFKGVLQLHPDNSTHFIYVLKEAEPL